MTAPIAGPAGGESDVLSQPIRGNDDVVRARQAVRDLAQRIGLSLVDQTKLVTAASEIARNTLIHGGGGTAHMRLVAEGRRRGVRVRFVDEGPGIPDLDQALTDGWTSGDGMGLGLSGSRRLVDHFRIDTEVGTGTEVEIVKWSR
ncbi:anti-sigma regulatory factor (plasmid) [Embleya sp. NBC_00888]|uniref:anti-sigma regulatory factor n=1 Tax=Embleya sp. NBC_00888 TaxID=2975960 RepID=UPI002F912CA0|nr:anti-sigma regulatory factor [Embleya sp. NBC_00888]